MSMLNYFPDWFKNEGISVAWSEKPVPVRYGWQLCNLNKKKFTEITGRGSSCTDWLCEAVAGWNRETLVKKYELTKPILLFIHRTIITPETWKLQKEFLNKLEQHNGLKKTKAFNFGHKLFLIPDKRILQSSVLTSFYTKFIRNLVLNNSFSNTALDFHNSFWKSDTLLKDETLTKILFSGNLLEITKDIPNPGGLINKPPSHDNLGIWYNLSIANTNSREIKYFKHAQNINQLQQQLKEVTLNALPSL